MSFDGVMVMMVVVVLRGLEEGEGGGDECWKWVIGV